jgi:spore coat protein JB
MKMIMIDERAKMLRRLMALDFFAEDLKLYLDTHPFDQEALRLHKLTVADAKALRAEYEKLYGPLTAQNAGTERYWNWIDNPWPWD